LENAHHQLFDTVNDCIAFNWISAGHIVTTARKALIQWCVVAATLHKTCARRRMKQYELLSDVPAVIAFHSIEA
jgi:hypothetical protein